MNFGLCNPPEPIYLYVRADEGGASLWYKFNIDTQQTIPVAERGLCGKLQELRLTSKEYKGRENIKLDIVIQADELYIIRSGVETNFAKTFLLAIAQFDVTAPLTIAVSPGEGNVVFCRLYDAATKQRIKADWDTNADWAGIISNVQQTLGQQITSEPKRATVPQPAPLQPANIDRQMLIDETSSLMRRKGIDSDKARGLTHSWYGKSSRYTMTDEELIDFRDRLSLWQAVPSP